MPTHANSAKVAHLTESQAASVKMDLVTVTPEMAERLLEHNSHNRPISDAHVKRIADQIVHGKWVFNGDTIKIADSRNVLDGQHRLWAVIMAKRPIETVIVRGVPEHAFTTMDTIRRMRSGADVLSLIGVQTGRSHIASALTWMIRWQNGAFPDFRQPQHRVENSDVETAWNAHHGMARAVERTARLRGLGSRAIIAAMFYIISNRDPYLAEQMVTILENPSTVSINHPFFRLRSYFVRGRDSRFDPVETIALIIKAANAAKAKQDIKVLKWQGQGASAESFPELEV